MVEGLRPIETNAGGKGIGHKEKYVAHLAVAIVVGHRLH